MSYVRECLKKLPPGVTSELKRIYYRNQIKKGAFRSEELEFEQLQKIIRPNDHVVDIGANVGHYTLLLAKLVGEGGRIIALEPIPDTFRLLSENVAFSSSRNITLINGAIYSECKEVGFTVPANNYYQSHMSDNGEIRVMCFTLDSLIPVDWSTDFIKIDAEGCDEIIIRDSKGFIERHRPIIMSEITIKKACELAGEFDNYGARSIQGSHNSFLVPFERTDRIPF